MTGPDERSCVTLVLPCLDEAEGLTRLLGRIPEHYSVIVVDNGSNDNTVSVALAHGATVLHEPRRGMGHAYRQGIVSAPGKFIVCLDGDATYPVGPVPALIALMQARNLDFLACYRVPQTGSGAHHLRNRIGNWCLTTLLNCLFRLDLRDGMSGMWILRRDIVPWLPLTEDGAAVCLEVKLRAFCHPSIRAAQAPVPYDKRLFGRSKLAPWRDGWASARLLWRLRPTPSGARIAADVA